MRTPAGLQHSTALSNAEPGTLVKVDATLRSEISPDDLDATVHFYTKALGFKLVRDERSTQSPHVALRRGHLQLGAAARAAALEQEYRRPPVGVVLEVEELDADRARVTAAAWPVTEELTSRPWGLRDFRLLDPHGYYWRITTSTP